MATKKEVTDKLTAMAPGEDILIIKHGPNEFDLVTLKWDIVAPVLNKKIEAGK